MPYDLVTPFGTRRGQVTPDEEMSQRSAIQAAQIAALRAQTDATYQLGHEQIGQEASRFGTYQQQQDAGRQNAALEHAYSMETGAQKGGFDLAGKGLEYGANNTLADIERRKYEEGLPLRQEEMSSQVDFLRQLRARMGGVMGSPSAQSPGEAGPNPGLPSTSPASSPGASGASGGVMSPDQMDQMAMYAAILNHKDPGDLAEKQMQRQKGELQIQALKQQIAQQQIDARLKGNDYAGAQALAKQSGGIVPQASLADVEANPEFSKRLNAIPDVIRNNNLYFTEGNLGELGQANDELMQLIDSLHAAPEVKQQIMQMIKEKMRGAIGQNTFGMGMQKIASQYGL